MTILLGCTMWHIRTLVGVLSVAEPRRQPQQEPVLGQQQETVQHQEEHPERGQHAAGKDQQHTQHQSVVYTVDIDADCHRDGQHGPAHLGARASADKKHTHIKAQLGVVHRSARINKA